MAVVIRCGLCGSVAGRRDGRILGSAATNRLKPCTLDLNNPSTVACSTLDNVALDNESFLKTILSYKANPNLKWVNKE